MYANLQRGPVPWQIVPSLVPSALLLPSSVARNAAPGSPPPPSIAPLTSSRESGGGGELGLDSQSPDRAGTAQASARSVSLEKCPGHPVWHLSSCPHIGPHLFLFPREQGLLFLARSQQTVLGRPPLSQASGLSFVKSLLKSPKPCP